MEEVLTITSVCHDVEFVKCSSDQVFCEELCWVPSVFSSFWVLGRKRFWGRVTVGFMWTLWRRSDGVYRRGSGGDFGACIIFSLEIYFWLESVRAGFSCIPGAGKVKKSDRFGFVTKGTKSCLLMDWSLWSAIFGVY